MSLRGSLELGMADAVLPPLGTSPHQRNNWPIENQCLMGALEQSHYVAKAAPLLLGVKLVFKRRQARHRI